MRKDIRLGMLPDPFIMRNGERVKSLEDWEIRRKEIIEDAISLEFDGMPPKPEVFKVEQLNGGTRGKLPAFFKIHCGKKDKPFSFCFSVDLPDIEGKVPAVLTGDGCYTANLNDKVIEEAHRRGFAVVKFNRLELARDSDDPKRESGINALWPENKFSTISAWAWGYHRVVDALMTLDIIDTDHIAITGHSRGGKTVLLAGATDERIRYTNPNGSGTHGCGAYRFIQYEDSDYGLLRSESLEFMLEHINYWMGQGLKKYAGKEETLPHDTHFFKALIAPRCFLETNGYDDLWANPRGSYLSFLGAKEVWKMYGAEDKCAAWYAEGGHKHRFNEFCALFDFMEADIYNKELPESFTRDPYGDMEPLHDYKCPQVL